MKTTRSNSVFVATIRLKIVLTLLVAGSLLGVLIRVLTPQAATQERTPAAMTAPIVMEKPAPAALKISSQLPPIDAPDLLALVNAVALDLPILQTMQTFDALLQHHLQQSPSQESAQQALARLINLELVWQAAQHQNYNLPADQLAEQLQTIQQRIAASNPTQPVALSTLLNKAGLDLSQFQAYLTKLLVADGFASQQASALQIDPAVFIQSLYSQAQISYGPAASKLSSSATEPSQPQSFPIVNLAQFPPSSPSATTIQPTAAITEIVTFSSGSTSLLAATNHTTNSVDSIEDASQATQPITAITYGLAIGDLPPRFSLPVHGPVQSTLTLDQLSGRPTVLSFWVSWCPYCLRQTPVLVAAAQTTMTQDVQFIGINVQEEPATIEQYVNAHTIPYPILRDSDGQVAKAYGVMGYPITYFLDKQGRIAAQHIGALTVEQLDGYLLGLKQQ